MDYSNERNDGMTYVSINLTEYFEKLSEFDWFIFETIVAKGISEEKDAKRICVDEIINRYGRCYSKDKVWRSIKLLVTINFFSIKKLQTGYRNFNIMCLTDIGGVAYMRRCKKNPPKQEHEDVVREHASLIHGYMIKDVKTILQKKNIYLDIETSRSKNRIDFYDGTAYIPDIAATTSDFGYHYYEVECGNHHQPDMDAKCDRMARLTKHLIFVGQNRKIVCGVLKRQLESWIERRGRMNLLQKGIRVYLTTMYDLDVNKWTYIYDMTSDEPISCIRENKKETENYES